MKRVLVLGCGEMGEMAIKDLYRYSEFDEIVVGTRSLKKARQILSQLKGRNIAVSAEKIDVCRSEGVTPLMDGCQVVVNCVGPNYKYEVPIALAAIEKKVNLIDINDDYLTTFEMYTLDQPAREAGIVIVLGLGASPGINNVFARAAADQLDKVEEIHTAWVMSGADPGGLALTYHLLHSLSGKALTYCEGRLREVRSFRDGKEKILFPEPVGEQTVYHIGHPEPLTLSRSFQQARIINDKATFYPPFVNDLIVQLGRLVRKSRLQKGRGVNVQDPMDFAAACFHKTCKNLNTVGKKGALRVMVKGLRDGKRKGITYASSGMLSEGTGMAASIGAQMLLQGQVHGKGVLAPEECVDWRQFLKTIVSRRIGRLDIKEEDIN